MSTFWLLASGAILGIVLILTTHGLPATLGGALTAACVVVAFQLGLHLRRARGASPN
jgi:hypothetical protein